MSEDTLKSIDKKYRIVEKIGGGGFSEVYLVEGPAGESALKLLKDVSTAQGKSALQEFKNEFAVLKNLSHPHIARILDFGYDADIDRYYYTSEMIRGKALYEATDDVPTEKITDLVVQGLRALEYLHSFHIYHFDIKSANVLVVPDPEPSVKLIDFGLAGIDPRGRLIGTPSYMSPEIVGREPADWRADLYSLGVLWYFCLARFNPFRTKVPRETLQNQIRLVPPPVSTFNSDVPSWMDAIIARLLEKNPAKRFSHAAAVVREINRFCAKKYPLETRETLVSYLPQEGELVGRRDELDMVRKDLEKLQEGEAKSTSYLVEGSLGNGKTRFLREFKYEAQLADVKVQMASAANMEGYSAWCDSLAKHLSDGKGLHIFILDDIEKLSGDEAASQNLQGLLSRARRPTGNTSAMLLLAMDEGCDEQLKTSLQSIIPNIISLKNFSPEELTAYLSSLTGLDEPPSELVEGIYRRTEGNPLFVTELLKALITGGGLFDEGGRWRATVFEDVGVDFSKVKIPTTVEELLLDGVTKMDLEERELLEAMSVVRKPSTTEQLSKYSEVKDPFNYLRTLVQQDFVEKTEEHQFVFRNELLGQTLYASMPEERREDYHDRIAAALKEEGADFELVAHHLSYGSDPDEALKASMKLGEIYLKRGLSRNAAKYLERATNLIPEDDVGMRVDALLKHGEALLIGRNYDRAEALFEQVEQILPSLPETERALKMQVETLMRLGGTFMKLMAFSRARAVFTEAKVKLHTKVNDPISEMRVENFLGSVLMSEGRYRESEDVFKKTRKAWRELSLGERSHVTNNDLGMVLLALHDLPGAREAFDEDLKFAEELKDDLLISRAHYNCAQLAVAERNFDDAIASYKECVDVCKRSENTELLLRAYNGLGNIYHIRGELNDSIAYYERGLALHERAGDARGGAVISINIGIIESSRKNFDASLDALIPAIEFLKGLSDKTAADWMALARGLLELGDVQRQQEDYESATNTLNRAYDIAVSHEGASGQRFWILSTLAEVAMAKDDSGQLKSLIAQMRPIANTEDEKNRLAEIAQEMSIDAASISKAVKSSEESASVEVSRPRKRGSPYEKVLEINKLINAEREVDYVLKTVIFYALELSGAESGAVILVDEDGELAVASHRNMDGREDEVAFSRSLARRVLEEGSPVITDNALEDDRFAGEESIAVHQLSSIMCLPVRAKGKIIGVLYLDHRFSLGAFSDVDMKLIDAFTDQVGLAIENARLVSALAAREQALRAELSTASVRIEHYEELMRERDKYEASRDYGILVTSSRAMKDTLTMLDKVADTDISVLLVGESGVGKELIARALHENNSKRNGARFVAINCAAIPANLMESELFGYKAGAFTGANKDKKGFIDEANGGTLFFDEIGDLDPTLQVKLLRVLQEREFIPVGGTKPLPCDVRILSATNKNLDEMVKTEKFRDDLFYRLCQVKVVIPPLRDRSEDIPNLVKQFVQDVEGEKEKTIHPALMKRLVDYPWPGNVRELQNVIHVACALTEGNVIGWDSIPKTSAFAHYFEDSKVAERVEASLSRPEVVPVTTEAGVSVSGGNVRIDDKNQYRSDKSWRDYEKMIIAKAFKANGFHVAKCAAELGVSVATLYKKINENNLKDQRNPLFEEDFVYTKGMGLDDYIPMIFKAALENAGGHTMQAIADLRVSQGYFYKVMKRMR